VRTDEQRRRLEEARARRETERERLAETAQQSFTNYIMELLRPVVQAAVSAVWNFFTKLFRGK
jgi:hypothetical protein